MAARSSPPPRASMPPTPPPAAGSPSTGASSTQAATSSAGAGCEPSSGGRKERLEELRRLRSSADAGKISGAVKDDHRTADRRQQQENRHDQTSEGATACLLGLCGLGRRLGGIGLLGL